uniref:Serine-threonine/tyrosine-protein kinase catalytic domain-containing protein n=1 Tax=Lactuca sativa TaxID=4236 RepID=A0A9R1XAG1_LACSA|nr:hypothetical protein LSAT_V11C600309270 [Lactuca sativa]
MNGSGGKTKGPILALMKRREPETQMLLPLILLVGKLRIVMVASCGVSVLAESTGEGCEGGRFWGCQVRNHQQYDEKADVFSFVIVLWELVTAKRMLRRSSHHRSSPKDGIRSDRDKQRGTRETRDIDRDKDRSREDINGKGRDKDRERERERDRGGDRDRERERVRDWY